MRKLIIFSVLVFSINYLTGQPRFNFTVSADIPTQSFLVELQIDRLNQDSMVLKMPAWTPGYYQILNFADNVSEMRWVKNKTDSLPLEKVFPNGWKIITKNQKSMHVKYRVKTSRSFVATPFVDSTRAYISPPGVFVYPEGLKHLSSTVTLVVPQGWTVATGLPQIKIKNSTFSADNFDVLFDCPVLMGPLEIMPSFFIKGIAHRFIAYRPSVIDPAGFMDDLKKIVKEAVAIIGDIPYKEYTFIGIGPGQGGIEHLNSTSFGFSGQSLKTGEGKRRMYSFLAHEYFHHFNVKRIRPIELGPFDYDKENRTTLLWVSEGVTVYYDQLLVRRAGLMSTADLLDGYRNRLLGYENKPGRLYQSATEASYNTWSDGPFGRSDDEINKTVSVYDKGAILGLMLDFAIRHQTGNKKSLDDVMRTLYTEYYQQKNRGFTPVEFRSVCEQIAGTSLGEIFVYAETVAPPDYKKYFAYGGLDIDTLPNEIEGAWLGIQTRKQADSLLIAQVEYGSPAWNAGLRRQMRILKVQSPAEEISLLTPVLKNIQPGEKITLLVSSKGVEKMMVIETAKKMEAGFTITKKVNPDALQQAIFEDWQRSRATDF